MILSLSMPFWLIQQLAFLKENLKVHSTTIKVHFEIQLSQIFIVVQR
jgi:hypothetical protein